jgi:hypothetical protein
MPSPSFLRYCTALLVRYEHDGRTWAVPGSDFVPPEQMPANGAYRFAAVPHISWVGHLATVMGPVRVRCMAPAPTAFIFGAVACSRQVTCRVRRLGLDVQPDGSGFYRHLRRACTPRRVCGPRADSRFERESRRERRLPHCHQAHAVRPPYLRSVELIQFPLVHDDMGACDQRRDRSTWRHVREARQLGLTRQAQPVRASRRGAPMMRQDVHP